jgi:glucose/arabinose dehydrogenase
MRPMRLTLAAVVTLSVAAVPAADSLAQNVDTLWARNCVTCHGKTGAGGNAKSMLDDEWKYGGSDRELFDSIKKGHPADGMEAYGETLSDAQIWGLVVYLREQREQAFRERNGNPKADGVGVFTGKRANYRVETVIPSDAGLKTPWSVNWLPDGSMLVTNRPGQLRVFKDGKLGEPIKNMPKVREDGQGGLMDVAVHPDFERSGWIYLSLSDPTAGKGGALMTKVVRGKIENGAWTSEETVFQAKPEHYLNGGLHFGSRIVFVKPDASVKDAQGRHYVFFSIGERGRGDNAQNLGLPNGKVHRVWDDGAIPEDNPFVKTDGAYPSIWSFGHRNPQGLVLDKAGNLWDTEHGPRGGDEVNLILKGRNYGWPLVSFGINYNGAPYKTPWMDPEADKKLTGGPVVMPAALWLPSVGACGLDVIKGPAFPAWEGDLVAGGLSGANVDRFRFEVSGAGEGAVARLVEREELLKGMGRVRDTAVGPDGCVYVVLNDPDTVIRIVPVK